MAVKPILLYPDPLLKRVAPPVLDFAEELHTVLKDLEDTLDDAPYCVGIAATQIAALTRVLLIDVSRSRKPVPNQGRLFLINPVIVESSGSILGREGCLSMPDLTANVTRAQNIRVEYCDREGIKHYVDCSDFEARVVLHELDHLDGLLFLDRVSSLKTDIFRRKRY